MANRREKTESCERFYFLGFQNNCGWWLQSWTQKTLATWKKSYDKPRQYIKKQRHSLCQQKSIVKSMIFPIVMYRMLELDHKEGWDLKDWCFPTDAEEDSWESPARRSNQSILKEINPEYTLEGLMLKSKLQNCGHLLQRADPLEKNLMLWKIEGKRRKGLQRMRWLHSIIDLTDMNLRKFWEIVKDKEAWCSAVHLAANGWPRLSDWTAMKFFTGPTLKEVSGSSYSPSCKFKVQNCLRDWGKKKLMKVFLYQVGFWSEF